MRSAGWSPLPTALFTTCALGWVALAVISTVHPASPINVIHLFLAVLLVAITGAAGLTWKNQVDSRRRDQVAEVVADFASQLEGLAPAVARLDERADLRDGRLYSLVARSQRVVASLHRREAPTEQLPVRVRGTARVVPSAFITDMTSDWPHEDEIRGFLAREMPEPDPGRENGSR